MFLYKLVDCTFSGNGCRFEAAIAMPPTEGCDIYHHTDSGLLISVLVHWNVV